MSSDSDDVSTFGDDEQEKIIRDFEVEGKLILNNLLPKKSCQRYEVVYNAFIAWSKANKTSSTEENVLLVYFNEMSKNIKPSTMWSRWSMLRTTLLHRHNVDISSYQKLKNFLVSFSKGYKAKQAKTLTGSEIARFLEKADDFHYLATKSILIFGICGAARCCELVNLNINDVEDFDNHFVVDIRDSKNDYPRRFVICAPFYEFIKKYLSLRPTDLESNRFFIYYAKGKCSRQVIGKHKIAEAPKIIAMYLQLEDPELYTGHSLRRTSATLLSDSGASLIRVKNLGGWQSDAVAQRYIDNSTVTKKQNFDGIANSVNLVSSASKLDSTELKNSVSTSSSIQNHVVSKSSLHESILQEVTVSAQANQEENSNTIKNLPLKNIENLEIFEEQNNPDCSLLQVGISNNSIQEENSGNAHVSNLSKNDSLKKRKYNHESDVFGTVHTYPSINDSSKKKMIIKKVMHLKSMAQLLLKIVQLQLLILIITHVVMISALNYLFNFINAIFFETSSTFVK